MWYLIVSITDLYLLSYFEEVAPIAVTHIYYSAKLHIKQTVGIPMRLLQECSSEISPVLALAIVCCCFCFVWVLGGGA